MFVPNTKILQIMIDTLINSSDKDHLLAKFCDQEILYTNPDESIVNSEQYDSLHRMKDDPHKVVSIKLDDEKD